MSSHSSLMPVVYIPHGGGPMPLLGDANHAQLSQFLRQLGQQLPTPKAIVIFSAHWEENLVTINSAKTPGMYFDYYGFPPASYQFNYPAVGSASLTEQLATLLSAKGISWQMNSQRGFDHGVFVPLMLMYPEASIPVVQVSLLKSLDPAQHIALGQAISALREQQVLILGSGMSFHNMQAFFSGSPEVVRQSGEFDQWLNKSLTNPELSAEQRFARLSEWQHAPFGRYSHPREEHLLPLMVCLGAAQGRQATNNFQAELLNSRISGFIWH